MPQRVCAKKLHKFCCDVMLHYGFCDEAADAAARVMVRTDMLGIHSHGVYGLLPYMEKVSAGGMDSGARPEVVSEGAAWAVVDGHNTIAQYIGAFGTDVAVGKAREAGIGYVAMRNSGHYGACGIYAIEAAERGMLALAYSNTPKNSTIPGTRGQTYGNNPVAYAAPCEGRRPIFMDISLSVVAGTRIKRHIESGAKEIPPGWAVDERGLPATDASAGKWHMAFMGGHKGYCMAVLTDILSAVLSGGALMFESGLWLEPEAVPRTSHAIIAINTDAVIGEELFKHRMKLLADDILNSPKADGADRIYLPGEMEWERYADAEANGIDLPDDVMERLAELSGRSGVRL